MIQLVPRCDIYRFCVGVRSEIPEQNGCIIFSKSKRGGSISEPQHGVAGESFLAKELACALIGG